MKWVSETLTPVVRKYIIQEFVSRDVITDAPVRGFYLYVYQDGKEIYDYLQDSFEIAIDQAHDQFGVPKDSWHQE